MFVIKFVSTRISIWNTKKPKWINETVCQWLWRIEKRSNIGKKRKAKNEQEINVSHDWNTIYNEITPLFTNRINHRRRDTMLSSCCWDEIFIQPYFMYASHRNSCFPRWSKEYKKNKINENAAHNLSLLFFRLYLKNDEQIDETLIDVMCEMYVKIRRTLNIKEKHKKKMRI